MSVPAQRTSTAYQHSVPAHHVPALRTSTVPALSVPAYVPVIAIEDVPALAIEDVPVIERAGTLDWRIEVLRRGKFWQWRTGRAENRKSRYGGKFATLSPERQKRYEQNKARRTSTRTRR